jgi:hypothetical protein
LAVVAVALLLGTGCGAGEREHAAAETGWRSLAKPSLSPREGALALWTGGEVLVLGGSDAPPCPPNANCSPPDVPPLADGAAYAPVTDGWRPIRDAPVPFTDARGTVIDGTAYVWSWGDPGRPGAESVFLAYRIATDAWERLPPPTGERQPQFLIVPAGRRLVAYEQGDQRDLAFDLDAWSWRELPPDPLRPSTGRVLVWSGRELILFAHAPESNPNSRTPSLARVAAYDFATETWRLLPTSPLLTSGPWFATGDGRLVNPTLGSADGGEVNNWGRSVPNGGILDPTAGSWSGLPTQPAGDDQFSAGVLTSTDAQYFGTSGWLLDLEAGRWLEIPRLPDDDFPSGYAVAAAADDLVVFGGALWGAGSRGELTNATRLWSPRT